MDSRLGPAAALHQEIQGYLQIAAHNPHLREWCNREILDCRALLDEMGDLDAGSDCERRVSWQMRSTWRRAGARGE